MKSLSAYRRTDPSFADLLNYAAVIDDGIVILKNGALMASWSYKGQDSASLTFEELGNRSAQVNNALQRLGSGWMTQHDVFRIQSKSYPEKASCHFPDPITEAIDEERRQVYQSGIHHENIQVITLTYLPPSINKSRTKALMVEGEETFSLEGVGKKNISYFVNSCREFESSMSAVCKLVRLKGEKIVVDIHGTEEIHDNQLRFIHRCITGNDHPITLPPVPMYLDRVIGGQDFLSGLVPVIGGKYIGAVCIDGFPQSSYPGILEGLDQLQFEYRWNNRFIYEDPFEAIKSLNKFRRQWQQKKRGFIAQIIKNYNAPVDKYAQQMEANTEDSISEALALSPKSSKITMPLSTSTRNRWRRTPKTVFPRPQAVWCCSDIIPVPSLSSAMNRKR